MPSTPFMMKKQKTYLRTALFTFLAVLLLLAAIMAADARYMAPLLRSQLHTLIVKGSDSLYTYSLGELKASLFGGRVEVKNLIINLDSIKYRQLAAQGELPPITMELDMDKGEISGVSVWNLLFYKKLVVQKIATGDANIRLFRHRDNTGAGTRSKTPLWKAIQPTIKSIAVKNIQLDGVKLLYRNADTTSSIKLQFDTCHAEFSNLLIDSVAYSDTSRVGFSEDVSFRFRDLKFRSPDSMSKMKAEVITYSSKTKVVEIVNFKVQPTREEKKDFYAFVQKQEEMKVITISKAKFSNFQLHRFINSNTIDADTVLLQEPVIQIYVDKTYPAVFRNKIGRYPHQLLMGAGARINVRAVEFRHAALSYTEKAATTKMEGTLSFGDLNLSATNVTNDPAVIAANSMCIVTAKGTILGKSPIEMKLTFHLDAANGRYDASGSIAGVDAAQLNVIALPFANTEFRTFNINRLHFNIAGNDLEAKGTIGMTYSNLFLVLRKTDKETGITQTNKFLTKIVNKYTLHASNPAPGEAERTAQTVWLRLSSQGFFGVLWKTIFGGMQNIMLTHGQAN